MSGARARASAWVLAAALVGVAPVAAAEAPAATACSRMVAVGDLHGAHEAFVEILRASHLLDRDGQWIGGDACLVQLGDIVDRGPHARRILDLLARLEREAPGRIHVVLGNHEMMSLVGDLRMVTTEGYAAFAGDETAEERERAFAAWVERFGPDAPREQARPAFEARFPPGAFARERAFRPDGTYGRWLLSRPVAVRLDRTVFVHGGLSLADARRGLDALVAETRADIEGWLAARDRLRAADLFDRFADLESEIATLARIEAAIEAGTLEVSPETAADLVAARAAADRTLLRLDGPMWHRDLARDEESSTVAAVEETLAALDADRIVAGHSPTSSRHVVERYWGRVVLIDTGAAPYYGGQVSAVEIDGGADSAVYLGRREALRGLGRPLPDADVERFLREGEIVHREPIGTGITLPERLTLASGEDTRRAAFKTVDVAPGGHVALAGGEVDLHFTDRHVYDVAAYLIDRMLGLGLVPVAVLRTIDGREGVVVDWVEGAVMESERRDRGIPPPPRVAVARRQAQMTVFDALIANVDRNLSNQLYVPADGTLHLIDHTRAFRTWKKPPDPFLAAPVRVPRRLYERLRDLDADALGAALSDLLSTAQIRALIRRRDAIVEKIERDVRALGEEGVFGRFDAVEALRP